MKQKIAGIISVLFDPFVEGPVILGFLFFKKSNLPFWCLLILLLINVFLPALFIFYALKKGFISDWETTKRSERYSLNLVLLGAIIFSFFLIRFWDDQFLEKIFLLTLILFSFYTLITFFWKISGHVMVNTSLVLIFNLFSSWRFWWLFFLIPLVAWARVVRKKHSPCQVLAGALLASVVILCGVSWFF